MDNERNSLLTITESPPISETESLPSVVMHKITPIVEESDDSGEEIFCQDIHHKIKSNASTGCKNRPSSEIKETLKLCSHFMNDKSLVENLISSGNVASEYEYYNCDINEIDCLYQNKLKTNSKANILHTDTGSSSNGAIKTTLSRSQNLFNSGKNIKKVQFMHMDRATEATEVENQYRDVFFNSSVSSHGTETILQRFDEIKNLVENNAFETMDKEDLSSLTNILATKLSGQKQRNKDLEEELALNEASLAKIVKELDISQSRLGRRENQLKETSFQLGKLQTEWKTSQRMIIESRDHYKNQCQMCRKFIETLSSEKNSLEVEVRELREKCQNYGLLQVQAEDLKAQLSNASKQVNEIMEENKRINEELKSQSENNAYYEKNIIPDLKQQSNDAKQESLQLHRNLDQLGIEKTSMESEASFLQIRLDNILKRVFEVEGAKKDAERQKESFASDLTTAKEALHKQYQDKVDILVLQRTQQLQDQVNEIERELTAKYESKLNKTDSDHRRQMDQLRDGLLKDSEQVRQNEKKLLIQVQSLIRENVMFHDQRKVIREAISYNPKLQYDRIPQDANEVSRKGQRRADILGKKFVDQPLITSTSLSNAEDMFSQPQSATKERKAFGHKSKFGSKRNAKRYFTYQDILDSVDNETTNSRRDPLIQENISAVSNIDISREQETPRHDTSNDEHGMKNRR